MQLSNEQLAARLEAALLALFVPPVMGLYARPRAYRCTNCGTDQQISTNHTGPCFDFCRGCSWAPSFGMGAPMFGRTYRAFVFVGEAPAPDEVNPHACGRVNG